MIIFLTCWVEALDSTLSQAVNYSVDKAQVGLNTAITQKVCKSWLSLTMLSCLGSFASWAAGGHTDLLCEPELSKRTMASEMGFCIVRSLYSFQILLKVKFKVGKGEPSCVIAVPNKWLFKGCEIRMLDLFICVHKNCSPKPGNGWNGASLLSFRDKLGLSLSQTWSLLLWGGNCVQESEQSKTSCMNWGSEPGALPFSLGKHSELPVSALLSPTSPAVSCLGCSLQLLSTQLKEVWLWFSEMPVKWSGLDWRAWKGMDLQAAFLPGRRYLEMQTSPEQCEVWNIFLLQWLWQSVISVQADEGAASLLRKDQSG